MRAKSMLSNLAVLILAGAFSIGVASAQERPGGAGSGAGVDYGAPPADRGAGGAPGSAGQGAPGGAPNGAYGGEPGDGASEPGAAYGRDGNDADEQTDSENDFGAPPQGNTAPPPRP